MASFQLNAMTTVMFPLSREGADIGLSMIRVGKFDGAKSW
jgi:hypothetical protein